MHVLCIQWIQRVACPCPSVSITASDSQTRLEITTSVTQQQQQHQHHAAAAGAPLTGRLNCQRTFAKFHSPGKGHTTDAESACIQTVNSSVLIDSSNLQQEVFSRHCETAGGLLTAYCDPSSCASLQPGPSSRGSATSRRLRVAVTPSTYRVSGQVNSPTI